MRYGVKRYGALAAALPLALAASASWGADAALVKARQKFFGIE